MKYRLHQIKNECWILNSVCILGPRYVSLNIYNIPWCIFMISMIWFDLKELNAADINLHTCLKLWINSYKIWMPLVSHESTGRQQRLIIILCREHRSPRSILKSDELLLAFSCLKWKMGHRSSSTAALPSQDPATWMSHILWL